MAELLHLDQQDVGTLPRELWLVRRNTESSISKASRTVSQYMPVPNFPPPSTNIPTTTVISAFFPPPINAPLQRNLGYGATSINLEKYYNGIRKMIKACRYLVLFLPPDEFAEEIKSMDERNVIVYTDFSSPWDLPHLRHKKHAFETEQRHLHEALPHRRSGEPHSWGCWNAKTYLMLEAMKRDPFHTSHFAWLDACMPAQAEKMCPMSSVLQLRSWPHPIAVSSLMNAMRYRDRAVVCCSYGRGMAPLDVVFTAGVPEANDETDSPQPYVSHSIDEIISIDACIMLGDKGSLSRLARARLIMFERDFARGWYVGREELQLSYAHHEFAGLYNAVNMSRLAPRVDHLDLDGAFYLLLGERNPDWSAFELGEDPEHSSCLP